jgi:hypothetical protein
VIEMVSKVDVINMRIGPKEENITTCHYIKISMSMVGVTSGLKFSVREMMKSIIVG